MAQRIQRTRSKTTRTWVFYFIVNREGTEHVFGTFDCKQPQRTNIYKELRDKWQSDKTITSIGYTTDLNSIWLKWPQSVLPTTTDNQFDEFEAEDLAMFGGK